jgi:hypothetical protein
LQRFLTHNNYSFKSYGDSLKDKLDSRSALSLSLGAEAAAAAGTPSSSSPSAPSQPQSPRRSLLSGGGGGGGGRPLLSLPTRPLLEEPERFMQTPIHTAPSAGFPFVLGGGGGGGGGPLGDRAADDAAAMAIADDRRRRRTVSGSPPDGSTQNSTEEGDIEVTRLCIDDGASHLTPGQKRRASSPASDEQAAPLPYGGYSSHPSESRRREGATPRGSGCSRGSPVPRLGMRQSSFSSASSASRASSHVYNNSTSGLSTSALSTSGLSASTASALSFGRRSPVPFSPSAISPLAASVESASATSPFGAPSQAPPPSSAALDPSPRGSISRIVNPPPPPPSSQQQQQQRSATDAAAAASRPAANSPRKLSTRPSGAAGGMQDFYMCECCLKKPKKFDTREELV